MYFRLQNEASRLSICIGGIECIHDSVCLIAAELLRSEIQIPRVPRDYAFPSEICWRTSDYFYLLESLLSLSREKNHRKGALGISFRKLLPNGEVT